MKILNISKTIRDITRHENQIDFIESESIMPNDMIDYHKKKVEELTEKLNLYLRQFDEI